MQLCKVIYYSLAALPVSSDIFAHHQENLNCITGSGITHGCHGQQPTVTDVNKNRNCNYSLDAPDDERKYRLKPVEQSRNNKLSYTVASCWSFCKKKK